jgi:hypothetical protein
MKPFEPKQIEGYEDGVLPADILQYLHLYWIRHNLFGPNGNLAGSWQAVTERGMYSGVIESRV